MLNGIIVKLFWIKIIDKCKEEKYGASCKANFITLLANKQGNN